MRLPPQVWDTSEGALMCVLPGHAAPPRHLAWAPSGAALASASADATPRVWAAPHADNSAP